LRAELARAANAAAGVVAADDVAGCVIRVASLAGKTKPATTTAALPCREDRDGSDAFVADLWLGRTALAATVIYSPSPHGDTYSLWTGPLHGPLRRLGNEWGWTDSDVPMGFGCAWAGGGVIATTQVPNRLAVEQGLEENPACPDRATTQITLNGAPRPQTVVEGSWTLLATDGKRLALARLDERGLPTGELLFVGLDGKPLQTPQVDLATVKAAIGGWLAPEGLVLRTKAGISGPAWNDRRRRRCDRRGRKTALRQGQGDPRTPHPRRCRPRPRHVAGERRAHSGRLHRPRRRDRKRKRHERLSPSLARHRPHTGCTMTRGGSAPRQLKRTGYAVGSSGSRVLPMIRVWLLRHSQLDL